MQIVNKPTKILYGSKIFFNNDKKIYVLSMFFVWGWLIFAPGKRYTVHGAGYTVLRHIVNGCRLVTPLTVHR